MRFLIIGIGGFVGPHLARALLDAGHDVAGFVRRPGDARVLETLHAEFPALFPGAAVYAGDVLDPRAVRAALAATGPDGLFHLAAVSYGPAAAADPLAAHRTNFFGALNVLTAVGTVVPGCRVLMAGSGDAYGAAGDAHAEVAETVAFAPISAYGVSKAAADLAAFQWGWAGGNVVRARPFNHTGPGQRPEFVCADFARQVARIEAGLQAPVLEVGNLDVERDFSDVRDIVRGYIALWEGGARGEAYNLCSGRGTRIGALVDGLCRRARRSIDVRVAAERRRPNEVRRLVGSHAKATAATGWAPALSLDQTLDDVLAYWRAQITVARG